jgi:hypothetical protein
MHVPVLLRPFTLPEAVASTIVPHDKIILGKRRARRVLGLPSSSRQLVGDVHSAVLINAQGVENAAMFVSR